MISTLSISSNLPSWWYWYFISCVAQSNQRETDVLSRSKSTDKTKYGRRVLSRSKAIDQTKYGGCERKHYAIL
jgi:hypothetical protein